MPRKDPKEQAKYFREWYLKNRDNVLKRNRQWKKDKLTPEIQKDYYASWYSEKGKEYFNEYQKGRNKLKVRAHWAVNKAVKKGLLVREPCFVCRETKNVDGHHYKGYDEENWLIVRWLCRKHHKEVEMQSA